jgi:chorismate mutase
VRRLADELTQLRRRIRASDKAILREVARRLATAERIGEVKRQRGLPVRNYEVEAEVIAQARALCQRYRIDQEFGEELMRMLIRASVATQNDGQRPRRRRA